MSVTQTRDDSDKKGISESNICAQTGHGNAHSSSNRLRQLAMSQGVKKLSLATSNNPAPRSVSPGRFEPRVRQSLLPSSAYHALDTPIPEGGRHLTFSESHPITTTRRASHLPSTSTETGFSLLGLFAAKMMSRKTTSTLQHNQSEGRRNSSFRKISSFSSASLTMRIKPPTYQLGPDQSFSPEFIRPKLESMVASRVRNYPTEYDPYRAANLCKSLANEIKFVLRSTGSNRYRYVVFCMIRQRSKQMAGCASRVLWDTNTDRSVCGEYMTPAIHFLYVAYAIYKE